MTSNRRVVRTALSGLVVAALAGAATGPRGGRAEDVLELPRIGTLGALPPRNDTIEVVVDAQGLVRLQGRPLAVDVRADDLRLAYASWIGARRDARGDARTNLLLTLDAHMPWVVFDALVGPAFAQDVRMHRVFLRVRDESTGEEGALAAFLPRWSDEVRFT